MCTRAPKSLENLENEDHPQRFKIYRWEDMVAGEVSNFVGNAGGLSKTVQDNTEMWKEPCIDGPGCLGDPSASGMTGTTAVVAWLTERRIVRERFGEHLLLLSRYQTHCDIAVMLSWYSAGYGWLGSYGQLVWTTTWKLGWKSRKYAPMSNGRDSSAERKC